MRPFVFSLLAIKPLTHLSFGTLHLILVYANTTHLSKRLKIFREGVKVVYVTVRDNNVDQALRVLKKKLQREGVFREMKNRRAYEKPSERRARESAESTRRVRKLMRKRLEREGY